MAVTYVLTRCYNVRRYERWEVRTDENLRAMQDEASLGEFDDFITTHGEELSSDWDTVDDDDLSVIVEEVYEEPEPSHYHEQWQLRAGTFGDVRCAACGNEAIGAIPGPPGTDQEAEQWILWAVKRIGMGFHPDTPAADIVTLNRVSSEALCACGETFIPNDEHDTVHAIREDGEECGLTGVITGDWGTSVPTFTPIEQGIYDVGLRECHRLLENVYETANRALISYHRKGV